VFGGLGEGYAEKILNGSASITETVIEEIAKAGNTSWLFDTICIYIENICEDYLGQIDAAANKYNNHGIQEAVNRLKESLDRVAEKDTKGEFVSQPSWNTSDYQRHSKDYVKKLMELAERQIDGEGRVCQRVRQTVVARIEEQWPDIFHLEGCTAEQAIATYLIAILVAPGIYNKTGGGTPAKECEDHTCVGRSRELQQLNKLLIQENRHIAVVTGPARVGKTTLVNHYFAQTASKVLYYNHRSESSCSFEKITQTVRPLCDKYLQLIWNLSEDQSAHGTQSLYLEKDPLRLLGKLLPQHRCVILVDHYDGTLEEIEQFRRYAEQTSIDVIFLTNRNMTDCDEVVPVGHLSEQALTDLFFEYNPDTNPDMRDVVLQISKEALGQAFLMRMIAAWYQRLSKKRNRKAAEDSLSKLLDQMKAEHVKDIQNEDTFGLGHDYDAVLYDAQSEKVDRSDINLIGHIYKEYVASLSDLEKKTYLILGCLGGVAMPRAYLEKWLNLDREVIDCFIEDGFCISDGFDDQVELRLPKILATVNDKKRKQTKTVQEEQQVIDGFIERFGREIRLEEYGEIELKKVGEIIDHVHDMLRYWCEHSLTKKKVERKEEMKRFIDFHLSCIRYCLLIGWGEKAKQLYEDEKNRTLREQYDVKDDSLAILQNRILFYLVYDDSDTGSNQAGEQIEKIFDQIQDQIALEHPQTWWNDCAELVELLMAARLSGVCAWLGTMEFSETLLSPVINAFIKGVKKMADQVEGDKEELHSRINDAEGLHNEIIQQHETETEEDQAGKSEQRSWMIHRLAHETELYKTVLQNVQIRPNLFLTLVRQKYELIARILQFHYGLEKEVQDDRDIEKVAYLLLDSVRMVICLEPQNRRECFQQWQMIADGLFVLSELMDEECFSVNLYTLSDYYHLFSEHFQRFSSGNHEVPFLYQQQMLSDLLSIKPKQLQMLNLFRTGEGFVRLNQTKYHGGSFSMNQENNQAVQNEQEMNSPLSNDYSNVYNSGYQRGFSDGSNQGQSAGYNNGYQQGYSQGFVAGFSSGFNKGVDLQITTSGVSNGQIASQDQPVAHSVPGEEVYLQRLSTYLRRENESLSEEDAAQRAREILCSTVVAQGKAELAGTEQSKEAAPSDQA
jgi:hypothetical protein